MAYPGTPLGSDMEGGSSGDEGPAPHHVCCGGCCGAVSFVGLILLACSFQGLAATNYGLKKNKVTGVVDLDNVYHGGRNCIGFWNTYVTMPATVRMLTWSNGQGAGTDMAPLSGLRTGDGMLVEISAAAQYEIVEAKVGEIYSGYKENIEGFFVSNLRSAWTLTLSTFQSTELWTKRMEVVAAMKAACVEICQNPQKLNGMLTCWDIQFLGVTVPPDIENQIEQTQVETQLQSMQKYVQQAKVKRANIQVLQADYDAQIGVITAQAEANAFQVKQGATSNAKLMWLEAKAGALSTIHDTVATTGGGQMTNAEMLEYLEKTAIAEDATSPIVYGDFSKTLTFTQEL